MNEREFYWINKLDTVKHGYNTKNTLGKCGGDTLTNHPNYDLISKKISENIKGQKNHNAKKIKCKNIETSEEFIFNTLEECRVYFNEKSHNFITSRCLHKTKYLYKGLWNIAYFNEDYINLLKDKNIAKQKKVMVIDLLNNKEFVFVSFTKAEKYFNFRKGLISDNTTLKNQKEFKYNKRYKITIMEKFID